MVETLPRPLRAALYSRVSTDDQDGTAQMLRLREWAGRAGHNVVWEETEEAGGTSANRPKYQALLSEARAHRVHVIGFSRIDRIARSMVDFAAIARELRSLNVGFACVDQGIDVPRGGADAQTMLFLHLLGAFAEFEVSLIQARTREALASKGRNGPWISKAGKLRTKLGRTPMITADSLAAAIREHDAGAGTWSEIALRNGWRPDSLRWAQRHRRPPDPAAVGRESQGARTGTTSTRNEKVSRLDVKGGAL